MPNQHRSIDRTVVVSVFSTLLLSLCSSALHAQPVLTDNNDRVGRLSATDALFIQERLSAFDYATQCTSSGRVNAMPRNDFRKLTFPRDDRHITLLVPPDVLRSNFVLFYVPEEDGQGFETFSRCSTTDILPVLALVSTAIVDENPASVATRQQVMAQHSFLTSHEPNRLMVRNDSDDLSDAYMDFTVSVKHPLFPNSEVLNELYRSMGRGIDELTNRDNGLFIQPYLSFSGRFSQYIGSRDSAPVVARRFNPAVFLRAWSSNNSYLDFGYAHESNGQSIDSEEGFRRAVEAYVASGKEEENAIAYARDDISRGWDYAYLEWRKDWQRLSTRLQARHYQHDGLFQGIAEEYNLWEDGGTVLRPRRQYDGVSLALEYDFGRDRCLEGFSFICFQKIGVTQETGYSQMFENNTTTLEFTSNFFGLPIQLWGRTGYGSDLVDYYNYSNSVGIGVELLSH
jgi:hypothetical protein